MSISTHSTIEDICFQIAQLDAIGQQKIFERIEKLKKDRTISPVSPVGDGEGTFRISDLRGVGAEIWQDENVNEYIRKERDSWD